MADVRVAVIGVGNVGSSFIKGLSYYGSGNKTNGLWHQKVAGLKPSNIRLVSAFDIDPAKVGNTVGQVVASRSADSLAKSLNVKVEPGIISDKGLKFVTPSTVSAKEFSARLEDSGADIALNLISSGLDKTCLEYAKAALQAGASFVNATPSKLASNPALSRQFTQKRLMLAGDDLLSQFGGTAFHKAMIDFMVERGVHVNKSYQLDVGGSEETKNTMDERIRMMKRSMKTGSIGMEAPYKFESVAGTTEYTDFLGDSRNSYYWMSSEGFLGSGIIMDLTLRTSDGANAGNVLFDIIRAMFKSKGAKTADVINAYAFKNPPRKSKIREAYSAFAKAFVQ